MSGCREDSGRRQTGRSAGAAARQVRADHKPEYRQGARPHRAAIAARPRRRGDRMRRREFAVLLAAAAGLWTLSARAQQKRMPTIGYLSSNPPDIPVGEVEAFKQGLADTGIVEGRDVVID